ncbi:hypothetical protein R1flu_015869 [Riccia fluitans]|uniref:Uncharacterized protein n=1 Tax=Riccia fluitans TaxID=41844 RepID=A0ABD1YKD5_9MARC
MLCSTNDTCPNRGNNVLRVLVDIGSGVNVMSNQIRIRLGYHRMAPPTTKLAMADNTLVWPLGVLSAVPVVVEGIRLIVSTSSSPCVPERNEFPGGPFGILDTPTDRRDAGRAGRPGKRHNPLDRAGTNQWVEVDIGTEDRPKIIRIGATLSPQERQQYVNLLREFEDVLAANYRDMKGIPPEIAEHRIDLLPNTDHSGANATG